MASLNTAMQVRAANRDADAWNAHVAIGDSVEYRSHPGASPVVHKTRTAASVLSGHTSVVWLEGKSGCVATEACRPVIPA